MASLTSDANTGAAIAAGIIDINDLAASIFIDKACAFTNVRTVLGTKADAEATKSRKEAKTFENMIF